MTYSVTKVFGAGCGPELHYRLYQNLKALLSFTPFTVDSTYSASSS
jgi:hypothetical protein